MRAPLLLPCLSVLVLAGCATPFRRHQYEPDGTGAARKQVVEKREKSVLVAFDRTICMVDAERYRDVQVRDAVWCNWQHDGGDATSVAPGGRIVSDTKSPVEKATIQPERRTARPRKAAKPAKTAKPAEGAKKKDD